MNKKKKKEILLGVVALVVLGICLYINTPIAYLLLCLCLVAAAVNVKVYKKNSFWAVNINNLRVISRNYDTLVIGEPIATDDSFAKSIAITCPGRSIFASKQIAYRLFSLLKPKGKLIITYKDEEAKDISSLDIHYIHEVNLYEIGVNRTKRFFPFALNPIRSLKLLLNTKYSSFEKAEVKDDELRKFCESRNIVQEYYKVK
jgi:hypothetical protein